MNMNMEPGGIIAWLIVGLIAGFLAGKVMRGAGYGIIIDIILGLVGAFVGGLIFRMFFSGDVGFWGSIAIAFVGSCIILLLVRLIAPARPM